MNRVVVTGIGAVTPLGPSFAETWTGVRAGRSGIVPITSFDVSDIPWKVAGVVKNFLASDYLDHKEIVRLDPFVHYAVAAASMALADAGLTGDRILKSSGVVIGSSRGGIGTIEAALRKGFAPAVHRRRPRMSAYVMPATTISMAASAVAQKFGIAGYCLGISNACASGMAALGEAFRAIKFGYRYPILCGGTEAPLCRTCLEGYGAAGALSRRNDSTASRPFDRTRDGFVLSEGACVLVLEPYESALARGAAIYGELIGYGNTTDAYHQTVPSAEGEARAILAALAEAGLSRRDIHLISAHGTSTPLGDRTETEAIKRAFGDGAYSIAVTAVKSATGHMLAASGSLEAAVTLMSLREGVAPPTLHLRERDPACDLDYVIGERRGNWEHALAQSFGFGGVNAVVVFRRFAA